MEAVASLADLLLILAVTSVFRGTTRVQLERSRAVWNGWGERVARAL